MVFSKVDKSSATNSEEVKQTEVSKVESSIDPQDDTGVQLFISNKVEYQGTSAMTIAFLKREPYKHLYLKDNEKKMEAVTPGGEQTGAMDEEVIDLSSQLQVINLGYMGQDSNIFELASTYVDFSFLPLFQDYKTKSSGANAAGTDASQGSAAGLENILKGF